MEKPLENKEPGKKLFRDFNLYILFGVTLMAVLGVASIAPAFPKIMVELGISMEEVGLLITAFTVPGIAITPFAGILADRFGRKKLLVPSLFLFGISGTLCAFTKDFEWILSLRFIQGIGAASLGTLNVTILGDLYKGLRRTTAMGYNASVLSIGTAVYPAIGGGLAVISWNYPFLLSFLAIPVGLLVLYSLDNPEPQLKMNLKRYLGETWRAMNNRKVGGLFIASVMTFIILYGPLLTLLPLLAAEKFHSTAFEIGILLSTMSVATATISFQLGRISKMFRPPVLIKFSFMLYAVALLSITFIDDFWTLLIPSLVFGTAHGINIPSVQTSLASLAPLEYRAAFMSVNGMVLRVGQSIGPVLIGILAAATGTSLAFIASAAISITSFLILLIIMK